jgi:iron complex transport system ATP-binding protein
VPEPTVPPASAGPTEPPEATARHVGALHVRVDSLHLGRRRVLADVDLSCAPGTHTAILGPNGAGKTSLLKAIAGLLPFAGHARVGEVDLSGLNAPERARRISYVPQRSMLDSALSVKDVVMQGRYAHRAFRDVGASHEQAVRRALETTDTWALRERSYLELSGGEQRRVLLARAMATEAKIIALDEPTAALDISHSLHFFAQLRSLAERGTIVITILHDLRDAERYCDRALVLADGSPRYVGSATLPASIVNDVYGVSVRENATRDFTLPPTARGAS